MFRGIPNEVLELILDQLKTKYYSAGEVIHREEDIPNFMGLIFVGEVEYRVKKRAVVKEKKEVILRDAFQGKRHPTITCLEETILLTLDRSIWETINRLIRRDI
jgi:signal-transduction protein with cAMP-binding, CBS, and nucleotidyltransferase domain